MDFAAVEVITFDCYGTLIDWETGILRALRSSLPRIQKTDAEWLSLYSEIEPAIQAGAYRRYRQVLRAVLQEIASGLGETATHPEAIADSLASWQPFADTNPALQRLKQRCKLAIISNIDDDLLAFTVRHLSVPFDYVITAEQVGSYKPSLQNFKVAQERIGRPKERILHVAESLFHDIAPANQLGIANVWVNRRAGREVAASRTAAVQPDLTVSNLTQLADLIVAAA